jgi:hypothetical protein
MEQTTPKAYALSPALLDGMAPSGVQRAKIIKLTETRNT